MIDSEFKALYTSGSGSEREVIIATNFNTNHPFLVELEQNESSILFKHREKADSSLATGLKVSIGKHERLQVEFEYETDDDSISLDIRQTVNNKDYPGVLSGSGRYDIEDSAVTINFNTQGPRFFSSQGPKVAKNGHFVI